MNVLPTVSDLERLRREVNEKREPLIAEKIRVEDKLGRLQRKASSRSGMSAGQVYDTIDEINRLRDRLGEIQNELLPLRNELNDINLRIADLKKERHESRVEERRQRVHIGTALKELRFKYSSFAADATRVEPMRLIAAEVAADLEKLISAEWVHEEVA